MSITIFGFLATIGGFVFYFGQMDVRIKNMEQRAGDTSFNWNALGKWK